MNQQFSRLLFNINDSGLGCLLTLILIAFLLGSVGLGWVVNGVLLVFALLMLTPVMAFFVIRWYLKRNLVEARCPTCSYQFTGFNNTDCRCPNCQEMLRVESGHFQRITPAGTIDVDAIEVPTQQLED